MTLKNLIDISLWDRAVWRGVFFLVFDAQPPTLALTFTHLDPADAIMQQWQRQFGAHDRDEAIRVSIIEGELPGREAGYTVHIGPNVDRVFAEQPSQNVALYATRWQRMQAPNSPLLTQFKDAYARTQRYWLAAAVMDAAANQPRFHPHRILKTRVAFRQSADIPPQNDPDSIVLARPEGARAQWN